MKALAPSDNMNRFFRFHFILLLVVHFAFSTDVAVSAEKARAAFLKTYCVKCHNAEKHKGDVRLDQLALRVTGDNHELWKEVIHNIQRGDMPPKDARRPTQNERRAFLSETIGLLTRHEEDAKGGQDPLTRLTNNQIAHSLQDLLKTHEPIADQLIGDPIDKHGFSRQAELDLSGSYLKLYTDALEQIIERAMPPIKPVRPDVFRIAGNDWEKCHWAGDNYLYLGHRRLYEGPKWIGDDFEIPIPPKHEYRMFLRENRSKGRFRIRLTLRNEPPENGQPRTPQEIAALEALVKGAIGFDQARGDVVALSARSFAKAEEVKAPWYEADWMSPLIRNVSALLVALLVIFGIGRPLLKRRAAAQEAIAADTAQNGQRIGREISGELTRQAVEAPDPARPVTLDMISSTYDYAQRADLIRNFVKQDPDRAALVVRDLLRDAKKEKENA